MESSNKSAQKVSPLPKRKKVEAPSSQQSYNPEINSQVSRHSRLSTNGRNASARGKSQHEVPLAEKSLDSGKKGSSLNLGGSSKPASSLDLGLKK